MAPSFTPGGATYGPVGVNEFLRSVQDVKYEHYTVAATTVPAETIDGVAGQKILQRGVLLAKITSGVESGKVGPYTLQAGVTDGRQTAANIVGINDTYLPWQLMERDVEVAVVYEASVISSRLLELDAAGAWAAVSGATVTALASVANVRYLFK